MIDRNPFLSARCDLVQAICSIIEAAYTFRSLGHTDLWIYFVHGLLHFHHCQLPLPQGCFVGYYPSRDIITGLSPHERHSLYRILAIVHYVVLN